jgi:hypothetical protein
MVKTPVKPKKTGKLAAETPAKKRTAAPRQVEPKSSALPKLPSAFRLLTNSLWILRSNWKVFGGIALIYGALTMLLVRGFDVASRLSQAKETIDLAFQDSSLNSSLAVFSYLLGSSGSGDSPSAGVYNVLFLIIISLAVIWALRQVYAGHKVRVRDSFYKGMAPLVPFVLVALVIVVQLIPMAIGLAIFAAVTANTISAAPLEHLFWGGLALLPSLLTGYFLSSSLFALYIATLPDMTPLNALRSARRLVAKRRWLIIRKMLFLPLVLMLATTLLVLPIIFVAAPLAAWVFFALTLIFLPVVHSYMYALYRSLL